MRPVEGTILTVVRRAAEAAEAAQRDGEHGLVALLDAAARGAHEAVARDARAAPGARRPGRRRRGRPRASRCCSTPSSRSSPTGRSPSPRSVTHTGAGRGPHAWRRPRPSPALRGDVPPRGRRLDDPRFSDTWGALGDSIVVVGGDGLWNCHVHTDDIGAAIEAGHRGRPAPQDPRHRPPRAGRGGAVGARARGRAGRVDRAVRPPRWSRWRVGDGVQRLLTSLGVQRSWPAASR